MSDLLIAYFSRRHENYMNGTIRDLDTGNTKAVALQLAKESGADLFEITPVNPYSPQYSICIEEAKRDLMEQRRPKLLYSIDNLKDYRIVLLGYPNYWGTMPVHVMTWLEQSDLSGKMIIPFCTHEGSGMGSSLEDLKRLCPDSDIRNGVPIRGSQAMTCELERSRIMSALSLEKLR